MRGLFACHLSVVFWLGYDQHVLKKDLGRWLCATSAQLPVHVARVYEPRVYHTYFLRRPEKN